MAEVNPGKKMKVEEQKDSEARDFNKFKIKWFKSDIFFHQMNFGMFETWPQILPPHFFVIS